MRFYDTNLDAFDENIEAPDGKPVTREEEEKEEYDSLLSLCLLGEY